MRNGDCCYFGIIIKLDIVSGINEVARGEHLIEGGPGLIFWAQGGAAVAATNTYPPARRLACVSGAVRAFGQSAFNYSARQWRQQRRIIKPHPTLKYVVIVVFVASASHFIVSATIMMMTDNNGHDAAPG